MRLALQRQRGIIAACAETIGAEMWQAGKVAVYLFGSRTDDLKRGGDIDLILLCDSEHLRTVQGMKRQILGAIGKKIGDCRVDLTIAPMSDAEQSEFVKSILPGAIKIFPERTS